MVVDPSNELYASYQGDVASIDISESGPGEFPDERVPVGRESGALALDDKAGLLYVATENSRGVGTVAVLDVDAGVDPSTGEVHNVKVIDSIVVGKGGRPDGLALDPMTGSLFVLSGGVSVVVIDTDSRKVIDSVPVTYLDGMDGHNAFGLDVDPKAGIAIATSIKRTWMIDTKSLDVKVINTGGGPVTVDAITGQAFITNQGGGPVRVVDTTTGEVVNSVTVGRHPGGRVAIDSTAGLAYVPAVEDGALAVVDTKTLKVVEIIRSPVGEYDWQRVVVDPSTGSLYAGSAGSVLVIAKR